MAPTLPTLSIEKRVATLQGELQQSTGMTAVVACRLLELRGDKVGTTRWSQAVSGIRPFENHEGTAALTLLQECVELRDSLLPLPISLRDPSLVHPLLEERRKLKRNIPEPRIFSVRSMNHFFVSKNDLGRIDMTFGVMMAATMSRAVANRVAETLRALGYEQVEVIANPYKGLDGLHVTFETLMSLPETEDNNVIIESQFEAQ